MISEMFLFQIYCFIHFQSNSKLPRTKRIVFLTRFVSGLWQSGAIREDKVIATAKQQYQQKFQKKIFTFPKIALQQLVSKIQHFPGTL